MTSRHGIGWSFAVAFFLGLLARPSMAGEVMQDRCKGEVAVVPINPNFPTGGARPGTPGTIVLKRRSDGHTDWSRIFEAAVGSSGYIAWWCNTGSGAALDPGVWRVNEVDDGSTCEFDSEISNCRGDLRVKAGSKVWEHWTAERSRCGDRSKKFRARLGPGRSLQIECMGQ